MSTKNFVVKNGLTTGNIVLDAGTGSITANSANVSGNLVVSGISHLGSNANVIITGGSANYVLGTDGLGNLKWVAQTGGGGGSGFFNVVTRTGNVEIDTLAGYLTIVGRDGNVEIPVT